MNICDYFKSLLTTGYGRSEILRLGKRVDDLEMENANLKLELRSESRANSHLDWAYNILRHKIDGKSE